MTREEAIQELQNCKDLILQNGEDWLDNRDIPTLDMAIKALSADRPTGEWIQSTYTNSKNCKYHTTKCSKCGFIITNEWIDYHFCPSCGAYMVGENYSYK